MPSPGCESVPLIKDFKLRIDWRELKEDRAPNELMLWVLKTSRERTLALALTQISTWWHNRSINTKLRSVERVY